MQVLFILIASTLLLQSCAQSNSQKPVKPKSSSTKVGGGCEGCEAIYSSPIPFEQLNWMDTLPDFNDKGLQLIISGTIYESDGKTPAKNVVLYIYHTDQTGHYVNKYNEEGYAGRNGYIKGWIRTNEKGQYKFYTLIPAAYPGRKAPAHIHPVVKESDKNEYWIDEYLFDNDPLLTVEEREKQEQRGGNGILRLTGKDGAYYGERDIILGKNIPGYPAN